MARRWTTEEDNYLERYWGRRKDASVARCLGRTVDACVRRAWKLGFCRRLNYLSLLEVHRLCGVDRRTVHRWIRDGYLVAAPTTKYHGNTYGWHIGYQHFETFLRVWPAAYDPSRFEPGTYWQQQAKRHHREQPVLSLDEASVLTGYSLHHLGRLAHRGRLPGAVRTRQGWRIPKAVLIAYVQQSRGRRPAHPGQIERVAA